MGQIVDQTPHKWVYEEIVDRVPPFRWLPPILDVAAQLLLVETVGIIAFFYFNMPVNAAIFGSMAIIYTVVWSAGCLYIIPWLRRLRNPTHETEYEVLAKYRERLFDRKYEIGGSVLTFVGMTAYLFIDEDLLRLFLGDGYGNPILTVLILVLTWDISYRIWLSVLTTLFAASRSISLRRAARNRRGLEYTAYSEVRTLEELDVINLYWGVSAVLLIPIAAESPLLLLGILGYFVAVTGLSGLSLMAMETIPWFPPDVESVLYFEKFAYVSACDNDEPHTTPVIFVYDGKYLYFAISVKSAKYRLIKKNRNIAVLVDMRDNRKVMNNRTLLMRGKGLILGETTPMGVVRIFLNGLWMIRLWRLFSQKYPKYTKYYREQEQNLPLAWQSKPFISRVFVRMEPESITYWREARPPVGLRV